GQSQQHASLALEDAAQRLHEIGQRALRGAIVGAVESQRLAGCEHADDELLPALLEELALFGRAAVVVHGDGFEPGNTGMHVAHGVFTQVEPAAGEPAMADERACCARCARWRTASDGSSARRVKSSSAPMS